MLSSNKFIKPNIYLLIVILLINNDNSSISSLIIGNFELLGDLMTQLKWLISSVIHGDANLLLAHYRDYKTKVPQNVSFNQTSLPEMGPPL